MISKILRIVRIGAKVAFYFSPRIFALLSRAKSKTIIVVAAVSRDEIVA